MVLPWFLLLWSLGLKLRFINWSSLLAYFRYIAPKSLNRSYVVIWESLHYWLSLFDYINIPSFRRTNVQSKWRLFIYYWLNRICSETNYWLMRTLISGINIYSYINVITTYICYTDGIGNRMIGENSFIQLISPWTKWPPFRRRYTHRPMHFSAWKVLYFD